MINKTSKLAMYDKWFDYTPVVSTFANLYHIYFKIISSNSTENKIKENHYYNHIKNKSFFRCIILTIPVIGNIVIGIYDEIKKRNKKEMNNHKELGYKDLTFEAALALVKKEPMKFSKLKIEHQQNTDIAREAYKQIPELITQFTTGTMMQLLKENASGYKYIPSFFKGDYDMHSHIALKKDGLQLQYSDKVIKDQTCFVHLAWKQNPESLKFAEKKPVEEIVQKYGEALKYACEVHQNDFNIVLKAVKNRGIALEFASKEMKNEKKVVLAAILQDPYALEFASPELRNDPDVVIEAIKKNANTLQFASMSVKNHQSIKDAIKNGSSPLQSIDSSIKPKTYFDYFAWRQNPGFLKSAEKNAVEHIVEKFGEALKDASEKHRNDLNIVSKAVANRGIALEFASNEMKNEKKVVLAAIQQDPYALEFASPELRNDPEVVLKAIKQDANTLQFACKSVKKNPSIQEAVKHETEITGNWNPHMFLYNEF